jgi:hypothetical protein
MAPCLKKKIPRTALYLRINEQGHQIQQLKLSLKQKRWRSGYDSSLPLAVNDFVYLWYEHYVCRHFLNGTCYHAAHDCHRIHSSVPPACLRAELRRLVTFHSGNLYYSHYFNALQLQATRERWASSRHLHEIRKYLHELLVSEAH